jgi:hypothetical protein
MRYFFLIAILNIFFTTSGQMKETFAQLQVQRFCCGGKDSMSFVIYKENGIFSAYYKSEGTQGSKELTLNPMSDVQIEACKKFIKKLRGLKQDSGCTTYYFYTLLQDGKTLERFDGGCKWYGIERLFQELSRK